MVEQIFDVDLPATKGTSLNILAMSDQIGIQGLIYLSKEPPRKTGSPTSPKWYYTPASFSTRTQNDPLKGVEEDTVVFPLFLIFLA